MGHWAELRVHGVRATAPEDMLDVDRVVQVAGDELGRVFRRADRRGEPLPEPDGHVVEAYHWGKLTSGSFAQALWLLLAPFGLVNAAQFTLLRPGERWARRWHALASAALRLVGLAMTVLFVLTVGVLTVDLWAWQQARATSGVPYAIALLAPAALLAGYWWAAGPRAPEARAASPLAAPLPPADPHPSELARRGFFDGTRHLRSLRLLHIAAGLAVVAVLGASVVGWPGLATALRLAAAVLLVLVVLVVVVGVRELDLAAGATWQPDEAARERRQERARWASEVLVALAAATALVPVVAVLVVPGGGGPGGLPGVDVAACVVLLAAVLGVLLLVVANLGLTRTAPADGRPFAPYARGWAATLLALLGLFIGVGYSGAFATVVAAALTSPERPVVVPEVLARITYAWGITALGLGALAVYLVVRRARALPGLCDRVADEVGDRLTPRWRRMVASAMWAARLKNGMACALAVFGTLGVVLTAFAAIDLLPVLGVPAVALPTALDVLSWSPQQDVPSPAGLVAVLTLGTLTLTGLATGLILLARTALFGASARRGVNVIWDVVAFWPRAVHPFVPSAYSARAVADIEDRIRWHLGPGGAPRLAVCGHSQGSLLTFAALVRLSASTADAALLERIAYLSFGSQLQVMFARGFPAYVNRTAIEELYRDLGGDWRNLYRDTDALAGPVLSWDRAAPQWLRVPGLPGLERRSRPGREEYGPDWRLADPLLPADPALQEDCLLPLRGHGEFWLDPAWYDALAEMGCSRTAAPAALPGEPLQGDAVLLLAPTAPAPEVAIVEQPLDDPPVPSGNP